ncbi:hypothetical protein, partial [Proteus terrae]|uniref:hypothetical protein n=1 Tax=Proteus terrae TaxID=1574161 RepID=UPI0034E5B664
MEKNAKSAFIATVLVGKKDENNERDITNIGYITFLFMALASLSRASVLNIKPPALRVAFKG